MDDLAALEEIHAEAQVEQVQIVVQAQEVLERLEHNRAEAVVQVVEEQTLTLMHQDLLEQAQQDAY